MNNQPTEELKRSLGFWSAISIVVGTIIGSGIFFKQGSVLDSAGSSTLAIAAWVFGGIYPNWWVNHRRNWGANAIHRWPLSLY